MARAQQLNFFPPPERQHGGSLAVGTRRSRRPLATREPIHVTMKSENAAGFRELTRHRAMIHSEAKMWAKRFDVRIYEFALCSNHLHMCVLGKSRKGLQHFFRVFAGQVAQKILGLHTTPKLERKPGKACRKNQRTYWSFLVYTRILTWGREFKAVRQYIYRNELEGLGRMAYQPREKKRRRPRT